MQIHDISVPISESLVVWPGDPPVRITKAQDLEKGDLATVSRLAMGAHTGTHVDAPLHFIPGGGSVDTLDLNVLIGTAWVAHAPEIPALTAEVLAGLKVPEGAIRLLIRTRNSDRWAEAGARFDEDFVAISECGALWLLEQGIRLVGVDYLSVGPFRDTVRTHEVLLGGGIIAVEGLDLSVITPGPYYLVCLPLKIQGGEGAPARVVLIEDEVQPDPAPGRVQAKTRTL
ncbi:cyclase family protein [Chloroflexota bacterium]